MGGPNRTTTIVMSKHTLAPQTSTPIAGRANLGTEDDDIDEEGTAQQCPLSNHFESAAAAAVDPSSSSSSESSSSSSGSSCGSSPVPPPGSQQDLMPPPSCVSAAGAVTPQSGAGKTGPSPDKMTFSAKKRFFEKEIVDSTLPAAKPERRFSFLSEDEVNNLRQEQEKKIANLTSEQLMNLSRLDDVEEADEEEYDDGPKLPDAATIPITITTVPTAQRPSIVRTAKAEKRLKDKLQREGLELSEEEKKLSPAEQRVLQAKKRAAWREARLKSLEQDAMQADMVIKKMSELACDTSATSTSMSSSFRNTTLSNTRDDNGNNNQSASDYSNNNEVIVCLQYHFYDSLFTDFLFN